METEAHRSDVFMFTVQAGGSREENPSLQRAVGNSCHQIMLNTMLKHKSAFCDYIHTEMVSNNTASSTPAHLV